MQKINNTLSTSKTKPDESPLIKRKTESERMLVTKGRIPAVRLTQESQTSFQTKDETFIDEEFNNTRYATKLYMQVQSFDVDEEYKFEMEFGGETKTVYIRHFGYIEVDGVNYSLVGFLDEHFRQKKSTIIRNVIKAFGLGGK